MGKHKIAVRLKALNGASCCGDAIWAWEHNDLLVLSVIDGLGHGQLAARAADSVACFLANHLGLPLPDLFRQCDEAVRHTRGVAMGVVRINFREDTLEFAGVGNVQAMICGEEIIRLDSDPGIVGGGFRALRREEVTLSPNNLVFMHTDGLRTIMNPLSLGAMLYGDVDELADRLFQDYIRDTDDAGLLVYRHHGRY